MYSCTYDGCEMAHYRLGHCDFREMSPGPLGPEDLFPYIYQPYYHLSFVPNLVLVLGTTKEILEQPWRRSPALTLLMYTSFS